MPCARARPSLTLLATPLTLARMSFRFGQMPSLVSIASLALLASCGNDGSGGPGDGSGSGCANLTDKLQSCHLIPNGAAFACSDYTSYQRCESGCLANVSCSDLAGYFCGALALASIYDCVTECMSFTCKNGDIISAHSRCDGDSDCMDGSDEVGCASPGFKCEDGTNISDSLRCDGHPDCRGGSDEDGCPAFTCKNGEKVLATDRCDTYQACADGSDEDGCPPPLREVLTCPSAGP
jgi:hypothetical protein